MTPTSQHRCDHHLMCGITTREECNDVGCKWYDEQCKEAARAATLAAVKMIEHEMTENVWLLYKEDGTRVHAVPTGYLKSVVESLRLTGDEQK